MVTLTNPTKVAKTFNIQCGPTCTTGGKCFCTDVTTTLSVAMDDGKWGTKQVTRKLPGAITLRGGESTQVADWVAAAPAIARAVASKALRLVRQ